MADEKAKKPIPKVKKDYGKPKEGHFRVVSFVRKGKGDKRYKFYSAVDIKISDKTFTSNPDNKTKQKTLLEIYKAKAANPNSNIEKVIE